MPEKFIMFAHRREYLWKYLFMQWQNGYGDFSTMNTLLFFFFKLCRLYMFCPCCACTQTLEEVIFSLLAVLTSTLNRNLKNGDAKLIITNH